MADKKPNTYTTLELIVSTDLYDRLAAMARDAGLPVAMLAERLLAAVVEDDEAAHGESG